jgi:plasmid stabilization system protein ParE
MHEVSFRPQAQTDLKQAVHYYAPLAPGLEQEFYRAVAVCVQQIRRDPEAFPALTERIRKINTRRFPYILLYAISGESVVVLRLVHNRSDLETWISEG